jgi:hypothetical protein
MRYPHSYSSLKAMFDCPKKYYELRIARSYKEPQNDAAAFGDYVHAELEKAIKNGTKLPPDLVQYQKEVDAVLHAGGDHQCEIPLGITMQGAPCEYADKECVLRGRFDYVVIRGHIAVILDWKTGKAKSPDLEQLELGALLLMAKHPEITEVHGSLAFIVAKTLIRHVYYRMNLSTIWSKWVGKLERAYEIQDKGLWVPKPSGLCKGWCVVENCNHWEPKRR